MRTVSISDLLKQLDHRQFDYYAQLSDEQRKAVPGPVALRFMSHVDNDEIAPLILMRVNEIANVHFYNLHQYPELQWRLLAACGCGVVVPHEWIEGRKTVKSPLTDFLQTLHPSASDEELDILYGDITRQELINLTQECALTKEQSKVIVNAFNQRN